MSDVWYEDPKTGLLYQDRKDSRGRTLRYYREDSRTTTGREKSSSKSQDPRIPRSRRDSVYSATSIEGSIRNERPREKSRLRTPNHDRADAHSAEFGSQPHRRKSDDSGQGTKYTESHNSNRSQKEYHSRGGYDNDQKSRGSTTSGQGFTSSNSPTVDSLTGHIGDLHVSAGDYYTLSSNSANVSLANAPHVESAQEDYGNFNSQHDQYNLSHQGSSFQASHATHAYEQSQSYDTEQYDQNPGSQNNIAHSTHTNTQQAHGTSHRYVAGTKGTSEKIDKSYQIRTKDYKKFFRVGRVFSTLWTEGVGGNADNIDSTFISEVIYGEKVHSKVRRFVVVREGNRSVTCLPVTSYAQAGAKKPGIQLNDHGFIYSRQVPTTVEGMIPLPLKVNISKGAAHLQDPSLVNYAKVYTVETNVKVKDVGDLDKDSRAILRHYFHQVFLDVEGSSNNRPDLTPRAAVLTGVGGATEKFSLPLPAANNTAMTSRPSSSGFNSTSYVSGYPPNNQYVNQYSLSNNRATGYTQQPSTVPGYGTPTGGYAIYSTNPPNSSTGYESHSAYNSSAISTSGNPYTPLPVNTAGMYNNITYAQTPQLQNAYQTPSNQSSHVTSMSDYQTNSYGSGHLSNSQYDQSRYDESAIDDGEEIELPSLESAQDALRQRRQSRSDRTSRGRRKR